MADIFLSYKSEDRGQTGVVAAALEAEGLTVWWDPVLRTGETYDEAIERELRAAHVIVVLWTPRSVVSRWVRAEATIADRRGALAPVMLEPCERPIAFELVQTADLIGWTGDRADPRWRALVAELKDRVAQARGRAQSPNAAPAPDPLTIETLFWSSIKDSADRADFETYLQRYPHGHFAELAANRLAAMAPPASKSPRPEPAPQTAPPPSDKVLWPHFCALLLAVATLGGGADAVAHNAFFAQIDLSLSPGEFEYLLYSRVLGLFIGGLAAVGLHRLAGRTKGLVFLGLGFVAVASAFLAIPTAFGQTLIFTSLSHGLIGFLTVLAFFTALRLFPDRRALTPATALVAATFLFPTPSALQIWDRGGLGGYAAVAAVGFGVAAVWIALLRWPQPPSQAQDASSGVGDAAMLLAASGFVACFYVAASQTQLYNEGRGGPFAVLSWITVLLGVSLGGVCGSLISRGRLRTLALTALGWALLALGSVFVLMRSIFDGQDWGALLALGLIAGGVGLMLALVWRASLASLRPAIVWLFCVFPPVFAGIANNDPFGFGGVFLAIGGLALCAVLIGVGLLTLPRTALRA